MKAVDIIDEVLLVEFPEYVFGPVQPDNAWHFDIIRFSNSVIRRRSKEKRWSLYISIIGAKQSKDGVNFQGKWVTDLGPITLTFVSREEFFNWAKYTGFLSVYQRDVKPQFEKWLANFEQLVDVPKVSLGQELVPDEVIKTENYDRGFDLRPAFVDFRFIKMIYQREKENREKIYRFWQLRNPGDKLVKIYQSIDNFHWIFYVLLSPEEYRQFKENEHRIQREMVKRKLSGEDDR